MTEWSLELSRYPSRNWFRKLDPGRLIECLSAGAGREI